MNTDHVIYDWELCCCERFMTNARAAWKEVFPRSSCEFNHNTAGDFVIFHGYLSTSAEECKAGILCNDPLNYVGVYHGEALGYKEERAGVAVKAPADSPSLYHLSKTPCASIKDPTYDALVNRFYEVRRFVLDNLGGMKGFHLDVSKKLGV